MNNLVCYVIYHGFFTYLWFIYQGSGKTLAFGIPLIHRILQLKEERAAEVAKEFETSNQEDGSDDEEFEAANQEVDSDDGEFELTNQESGSDDQETNDDQGSCIL
jgi:hypothetical protein